MSTFAIQKAVYERLTDQLNVPVYDDVPQNTKLPYVTIGEDDSEAWDTDDSLGLDTDITIHVWSEYAGRKEAKELMGQIYNALNRHELVVDGMHTVDCIFEYQDIFLDPDGVTRHGVIRFRLTTEAA